MWYMCLSICAHMYVSVYVCMCNGWVSGVFLGSLSTLLIETKSLTKTEAWQFGCSVKPAWPGNPICLSNPGVTGGLQYTSYFNGGAEYPNSTPPVCTGSTLYPESPPQLLQLTFISSMSCTLAYVFSILNHFSSVSQRKPGLPLTNTPRSLPCIYKAGILCLHSCICVCVHVHTEIGIWRSTIDRCWVSSSTTLHIFQHRVFQ